MNVIVKRTAILLCGVVIAALLGTWLGTIHGNSVRVQRRSNDIVEQASLMASQPDGIAVGRAFPSIHLWSLDGNSGVNSALELVPGGGILVSMTPSCRTCLEVAVALRTAIGLSECKECGVGLILNGDEVGDLPDSLRANGIVFPTFVDAELILYTRYKVVANPTYFVVDGAGIVKHIGAGVKSPTEFSLIINEFCSSGK